MSEQYSPISAPRSTLYLRRGGSIAQLVPGVVLCIVVATAAMGLHQVEPLTRLSPIILSILIGILLANASGLPEGVGPGIALCSKGLLRLAVMLLGCQITLSELLAFGLPGLLALVGVVAVTLVFTLSLGRAMGMDPGLAALVAAGTAVCGASAIAAANSVTRSREELVAYAIGIVTLFGTLGLFLYPPLKSMIGLSDLQYGIWAGLSLHEVAQAVAAGFAEGDVAGRAAVTVKLGRVLLLSVVVAGLAQLWVRSGRNSGGEARVPLMPWFLAGFLVLAGLNSTGVIPAAMREWLAATTPLMMALAMAGIGLGTRLDRLAALGLRPLALGAAATAMISALALGIALLIG